MGTTLKAFSRKKETGASGAMRPLSVASLKPGAVGYNATLRGEQAPLESRDFIIGIVFDGVNPPPHKSMRESARKPYFPQQRPLPSQSEQPKP